MQKQKNILGKEYSAFACMFQTSIITSETLREMNIDVDKFRSEYVNRGLVQRQVGSMRLFKSKETKEVEYFKLGEEGEKFCREKLGLEKKAKFTSLEHDVPMQRGYVQIQRDMKEKGFTGKEVVRAMSTWKIEEVSKKETYRGMKEFAEEKSEEWGVDVKKAREMISCPDAVVTILDHDEQGQVVERTVLVEGITDTYTTERIAAKYTWRDEFYPGCEIIELWQEGR